MPLYKGITLPGRPDLENIRRLDCLPIAAINAMSRLGIAIDIPWFQDLSSSLSSDLTRLHAEITSHIPPAALGRILNSLDQVESEQEQLNVNSPPQISALLYDRLRIGVGKEIKLTKSGRRTTGKKQLEMFREAHPVIPLILAYKERYKLKTSFADSLPLKAKLHPRGPCCPVCELSHVAATYRVHTEFTTTRADTGRLSSRKPNLQQIPARTELGAQVRLGFIASPGTRLVSCDFSQIELRNLAHCAKSASMIEIYKLDKDIHIETACKAFGRNYEHYAELAAIKDSGVLTPAQKADWSDFALNCRMPSKNVNFLVAYGSSAKGLQAQLALSKLVWSIEQCEQFIKLWFSLYPEVESYMAEQSYRARRYGFVWDLFGRIRRVPEIHSSLTRIRAAGLRQAGNQPIQAVSAGQMKLVMAECQDDFERLQSSGVWAHPLLTIHDQLMAEVEEDLAEEVLGMMSGNFSRVMIDRETGADLWKVKIKSDGQIMERWRKD